jgi:hypothetical protein
VAVVAVECTTSQRYCGCEPMRNLNAVHDGAQLEPSTELDRKPKKLAIVSVNTPGELQNFVRVAETRWRTRNRNYNNLAEKG